MAPASSRLKPSTAVSNRAARVHARKRLQALIRPSGHAIRRRALRVAGAAPDRMEQFVEAHARRKTARQAFAPWKQWPSERPGQERRRYPGRPSGPGHSGADRANAAPGPVHGHGSQLLRRFVTWTPATETNFRENVSSQVGTFLAPATFGSNGWYDRIRRSDRLIP